MASSYLSRTFSGSYNSGTISMWVKRTNLGSAYIFYNESSSDSNDYGIIQFDSNDRIEFMTVTNGTHTQKLITNRKFRDTSAWYHFVFSSDTDNSTADNRLRIYVNGVEETSYNTRDNGSQGDTNYMFQTSATNKHRLFASAGGSANLDAIVTHIHIVPNAQLAPTVFGETDSTSGIWKPKTSPSVTYTAQGVFLKFENSGNIGLDSSGNTNNMTASGTITQNVDTPSNVYTTWNNLSKRETATNGALQIHPAGDASYSYSVSTLGASQGKWYFEFKSNAGNGRALIGMVKSDYAPEQIIDNEEPGANAHSFAYRQNQGDIQLNNSTSSYGTQVTWTVDGGILMMAVDLDNNKVWYGVDGTWQNSGDPSNGTNGFDWSAVRTADEPYLCLVGDDSSSAYGNTQANFGSGFFGTTAVASANADANGHGIFEYTVPTGFYTLNTKNIKEFG